MNAEEQMQLAMALSASEITNAPSSSSPPATAGVGRTRLIQVQQQADPEDLWKGAAAISPAAAPKPAPEPQVRPSPAAPQYDDSIWGGAVAVVAAPKRGLPAGIILNLDSDSEEEVDDISELRGLDVEGLRASGLSLESV